MENSAYIAQMEILEYLYW